MKLLRTENILPIQTIEGMVPAVYIYIYISYQTNDHQTS